MLDLTIMLLLTVTSFTLLKTNNSD